VCVCASSEHLQPGNGPRPGDPSQQLGAPNSSSVGERAQMQGIYYAKQGPGESAFPGTASLSLSLSLSLS